MNEAGGIQLRKKQLQNLIESDQKYCYVFLKFLLLCCQKLIRHKLWLTTLDLENVQLIAVGPENESQRMLTFKMSIFSLQQLRLCSSAQEHSTEKEHIRLIENFLE